MGNVPNEDKILRLLQAHGALSISLVTHLTEMDESVVQSALSSLEGEGKIHRVYDFGEKWAVGRG